MSKLLPIVVLLTLTPGFLWWIVIASLLPGLMLLADDVRMMLERRRERAAGFEPALVPIPVHWDDRRR